MRRQAKGEHRKEGKGTVGSGISTRWKCWHSFCFFFFFKQTRSHGVMWREEIYIFKVPRAGPVTFIPMISSVPALFLRGKHFISILQVEKRRLRGAGSWGASRWRCSRPVGLVGGLSEAHLPAGGNYQGAHGSNPTVSSEHGHVFFPRAFLHLPSYHPWKVKTEKWESGN